LLLKRENSVIEMLTKYKQDGYILYKNNGLIELIAELKLRFENFYIKQFGNDIETNRNIIKRFGDDIECQKIFINTTIVEIVQSLGINIPVFCGPTFTHYTANNLTGNSYGLPLHQDWPSMGSSMNSLIIWVNLQHSGVRTHSISVAPGMHKGLLPGVQCENGYILNSQEQYDLEVLEIQAGELLIMNSFLPHKTYVSNVSSEWKLSMSRRVDDFDDEQWANRGYKNAYANSVNRNLYLK